MARGAGRWVPADGVLVHEEDGDAFVLQVSSGQYFGLNRTGLLIWSALVEGVDPVDALTARWPGRDRSELEADADRLVAALAEAGLVTSAEPGR